MDWPQDESARLHPTTGHFTDGEPGQSIPASKDSAEYQNMLFLELLHLITKSGQTPDFNDRTQVYKAIQALVADKPLGEPYWHLGETPETGSFQYLGVELDRTVYSALWDSINEPGRNVEIVSDAEWSAGRFGCWSTGDGSTTFRSPLVLGDFIRVWDSSGLIDPSRLLGSFQDQDTRWYKATGNNSNAYNKYSGGPYDGDYAGKDPDSNSYNLDKTIYTWDETHNTHPRNTAWMLCFRYQ